MLPGTPECGWTASPSVGYTLCGFSPVHGDTIAVLEAYIDESGTHNDRFLVVAAYISQVEKWAAFAQEWKGVLVDYSLPSFHMKDFRNPHCRVYKHLTARDKESLLGGLIDVIHRHILIGVAFASSPKLYKKLTTPAYRSRHGSCYSMSIQGCLFTAFPLLHRLDAGVQTVGIFVEEGHRNAREVIEMLAEVKRQTNPIEIPDDVTNLVYGGPLDVSRDPYSGKKILFFWEDKDWCIWVRFQEHHASSSSRRSLCLLCV